MTGSTKLLLAALAAAAVMANAAAWAHPTGNTGGTMMGQGDEAHLRVIGQDWNGRIGAGQSTNFGMRASGQVVSMTMASRWRSKASIG